MCTHLFIGELITIAKKWKQQRYPLIDEWTKTHGIVSMEQLLIDDTA